MENGNGITEKGKRPTVEEDAINEWLCILHSRGDRVIEIRHVPYMDDETPCMATIITYEMGEEEESS